VLVLRRTMRTRGATFGMVIIALALFATFAAPLISPYDPIAQDYNAILSAPNAQHWLGTDQLGRDVLSRIIYGAQVSMQAAWSRWASPWWWGVVVGLAAGYRPGWLDDVLMRIMDALWSFPSLVLALAITAALGPG